MQASLRCVTEDVHEPRKLQTPLRGIQVDPHKDAGDHGKTEDCGQHDDRRNAHIEAILALRISKRLPGPPLFGHACAAHHARVVAQA